MTADPPDESPDDAPDTDLADQLREWWTEIQERIQTGSDRTQAGLTSRAAKWVYVLILVNGSIIGVGYLSWRLAGPVPTLVYFVLFTVGVTMIPGVVLMFGNAIPGSTALGKLNLVLGAFAFGRHALVQTEKGWRWCPAREHAIWIHGEWVEIDGGLEHWSVLGWRPFAVARLKTDETLQQARIDTRAEQDTNRRGTAADGGAVERGGQTAVEPPIRSGDDGTWVVDLTRLFTPGLKKFGDIELIETAEEIKMREESGNGGSLTWWQPMVHGTVGIILGCAIGYVILYM